MRDFILNPVCETLGLAALTGLDLLNSFFCEHPDKYYFIYTLEQKIKGLEDSIT